MKRMLWAFGTSVLALSLMISGCSKKESEAEKQLAETQKQLEEAKKKLEEAAAKAEPAVESAGAAAGAVAAKAGAVANSAVSRAKSDVAATKTGLANNAAAIDQNKAAINQNRAGIEKNSSGIEQNRQGVEEAKRMAAPAPIHTIPAGTPLSVRTTGKLSTKTAANGSLFEATLDQPLEIDGYLVAARGATVEGVVVSSDPGGRVKGVASITVALRRIIMADGRSLAIKTGQFAAEAKKSGGKDALKVGVASGIGAAIGAIAGGGKGAAIGAGAGAAGGTGMVLGTRGAAAELPAETVLSFKLAAPVNVQELKR
ncbi:MAG: hypothetical protein IPP47_33530 [Bryobacterales bacterium]|nr:hypothetical protein [Bryobacterales bacterium]